MNTKPRKGLFCFLDCAGMTATTANKNLNHDEILAEFERLFEISYKLSQSLNGLQTESQRQAVASDILVKIVLNAVSILKIYPHGKYSCKAFNSWDISSVASLARNLLESSNILYYLCIEQIEKEEISFRYLLYKFHTSKELLSIVTQMGGTNGGISDLKEDCEQLLNEVKTHKFFQALSIQIQPLILKGKRGFCLTQNQITERRGIELDFFTGVYKFLSTHTHTAPHAIEQIRTLNMNGLGSEPLKVFLSLILNHASHYLALTISDVIILFDKKEEYEADWEFLENYRRELCKTS